MANENATISKSKKHESLDFDELERQLQESLDEQMADLDFLDEQKEQIGDPDALGNVILNTVWEQFTNQIAIQAGEDFIKDNNMLKLDLSNDIYTFLSPYLLCFSSKSFINATNFSTPSIGIAL